MKRVENIVTMREISPYEQFHVLLHCFQKLSTADASKLMWERESVCTGSGQHVRAAKVILGCP